jgi:hypothetical protein
MSAAFEAALGQLGWIELLRPGDCSARLRTGGVDENFNDFNRAGREHQIFDFSSAVAGMNGSSTRCGHVSREDVLLSVSLTFAEGQTERGPALGIFGEWDI